MKTQSYLKLNKKEAAITFLVFIVLAFIVFGNSIPGQFIYDDQWVIVRNPVLKDFSSIPGEFISPYHIKQPETGLYRPLTLVSFSINYVFGDSPIGFHAVNILIHAINLFLIFVLLYRLFKSKRLAYLASFLFLLLPIHTEAVASIVGRADILAFMFSILALLFVYNRKYWQSSAVFLLALLSKESAIGLVPIILFMIWREEGNNLTNFIKKSVKFAPTGAIYLVLRFITLKSSFLKNDADMIYNPLKFTDLLSRFFTALKIMLFYIWKTLVPTHLSADYSYNQINLVKSFLNPFVLSGLALILLMLAAIHWRKTRFSPLGFGSLFFLSTFFVVSNFIFPIGTIMAERTFYMPSLGIAVLVAWLINLLMDWKFRNLWRALFLILLLIYGFFLVDRNKIWLNRESLYLNMVKTAPMSAHAKTNLGIYYIQNNQWDKGKILLADSYKMAPEHLPTLDSLGIIAEHERKLSEAENFYQRALQINPHYATALSNLGRMYFEHGQYAKSAEIFWHEFSYSRQSGHLLVYAMSQAKLGNYNEVISVIKNNFGDYPKDINLRFVIGYAYFKKGDKLNADKYFKESRNPAVSDEEFLKGLENF